MSSVTQLTPELIEDYRQRKLILEEAGDIELEPVAGLTIIGELTAEEQVLYVEVLIIDERIQDWVREINARAAEGIAAATRKSDGPRDVPELLKSEKIFKSDGEAEEYFGEVYRMDYLKAMLWFTVRERLHSFATSLGVRAGYKVCRVGYKYHRVDDGE